MARESLPWVRRLSFAAVLVVTAVAPGPASGSLPPPCNHSRCDAAGAVSWARLLPGSWIMQSGLAGTTPAHGQAYAALGNGVAAVGAGTTVWAFSTRAGRPLWAATLTGFPAGSSIVSVRVWPGSVSAGVELPLSSSLAQPGPAREDVLLSAATGRRLRAFPAAPYGGVVSAGPTSAVVVGAQAVTAYASRTGRVLWSRPTGRQPQAWRKDGGYLYVAVAAGGYLGTAPVTALRRIDLATGAEDLVRPPGRAFAGKLSLTFGGVALFTDAGGVTAYSALTGARLWQRAGAVPQSVDAVARRVYLLTGSTLVGVDPATGATLDRVSGATAGDGLYGVREGAVLGLDHGALGRAWGYDVASQRVIWSSALLPWPHFFVDLSGLGGSTSPGQDGVLLAVCAQPGRAPPSGPRPCARPELILLTR